MGTSVAVAGQRARSAATTLATASRRAKDTALLAMADALVARTDEILRANSSDVARGHDAGLPAHLIDRLTVDAKRVAAMADGLGQLAGLPDPVGEVVR
ncbi:MAG TPA: gamma-glutamyl-phosphate reductase, partial [Micromonosporaceae bacterium]